jgi:hypothetical protein
MFKIYKFFCLGACLITGCVLAQDETTPQNALLQEFLDVCERETPFSAMANFIDYPLEKWKAYHLSNNQISIINALFVKIVQETKAVEKKGKEVRSYLLSNGLEIPMHSTKSMTTVAGNHASGDDRQILAVVLNTSDKVLCRQADPNEIQVYDLELKEYDVVWIAPNIIHAFKLPPNTDLLIFPDKMWAPAPEHSFRQLISPN